MPKFKRIFVVTFAAITLIGCSASDEPNASTDSVSAATPMSYDIVSEQVIDGDATMTQKRSITILREKTTRCYYTMVASNDATTFTQMFETAGAGTMPYCDDE